MEAIINKTKIFNTIEADEELCGDCHQSKVIIEDDGPDFVCRTLNCDDCHRVDTVVEDVKAFVEDNIDMLQFIDSFTGRENEHS